MSSVSKFPTRSRLMMFEKRDNGRWICDGRFAFFCMNPTMTNVELNMESAVYEKFRGDLIQSKESLPSFAKIEERVSNCNIETKFVTFEEGMVVIRFNDRFPDEIRGDNYVIRYTKDEENYDLYLPEKIWEYIETFFVGSNISIRISHEEGNIVLVSDELDPSVSGVQLNGHAVIGILNSRRAMYDVNTLI